MNAITRTGEGAWAKEDPGEFDQSWRVETEGFHALGMPGSDFEKQMIAQTPLGRIGQPHDIAPVAVFLASSDSGWITGETLGVVGGLR